MVSKATKQARLSIALPMTDWGSMSQHLNCMEYFNQYSILSSK